MALLPAPDLSRREAPAAAAAAGHAWPQEVIRARAEQRRSEDGSQGNLDWIGGEDPEDRDRPDERVPRAQGSGVAQRPAGCHGPDVCWDGRQRPIVRSIALDPASLVAAYEAAHNAYAHVLS